MRERLQSMAGSPILRALMFGALMCALAWLTGLLNWRTAAKLAGWWLLMSAAAVMILGTWQKPQWSRWVGFLLVALFALDIGVQGVIRDFFGSSPTPSLLVDALVHTNPHESAEFVREHWRAIARSVAFAAIIMAAAHFWFARRRHLPRYSWRSVGVVLALLVLVGFNPTMLRQNPLARWPVLIHTHYKAQQGIAQVDALLQTIDAQSDAWRIERATPTQMPKTVVVLIGESGNRDNWGLYGYARDTTAPLARALQADDGQFLLFTDAWSSDAFTQPSLTKALSPANVAAPDLWQSTPAITQMARKAGYTTAWLSNQMAQEGWFGALARRTDEARFINAGNWRDSSSTDGQLIPYLRGFLHNQTSEQELIVLHLMGQHFYYDQRCPTDVRPFSAAQDSVAEQLRAAGRLPHIITARNEYDNAIYCGAQVFADVLQAVRDLRSDRAVAVLYFSDHGQEVGHNRNFSGHSQQDLSGFSIPMALWHNRLWPQTYPQAYAQRPIRTDYLDQMMQHLLGIRSAWYDARQDVLSPDYQLTESPLPKLTQ